MYFGYNELKHLVYIFIKRGLHTMAKFRVYAVKKGRKTGIFHTWAECEAQTKGFSGPVFKGFMNEEEAQEWLDSGNRAGAGLSEGTTGRTVAKAKTEEAPIIDIENFDAEVYFSEDHLDTNALPPVMPKAYAFVDGSYNEHHENGPIYGYGGIVHVNGEDVPVHGNGNEPEFVVSHQIPGEVFGALAAIEKAIELGAEHLVLFYDYNGIGHWATSGKRWKAESAIARRYMERYTQLTKQIKVNFYHVKAHDNIEGNELVDKMAKKEVGL